MKICISKHDKNPSPHLLSFSSFPNMEQCPGRAAESTDRADTSGMQGETPKNQKITGAEHTAPSSSSFKEHQSSSVAPSQNYFFSEVEDDNPKITGPFLSDQV